MFKPFYYADFNKAFVCLYKSSKMQGVWLTLPELIFRDTCTSMDWHSFIEGGAFRTLTKSSLYVKTSYLSRQNTYFVLSPILSSQQAFRDITCVKYNVHSLLNISLRVFGGMFSRYIYKNSIIILRNAIFSQLPAIALACFHIIQNRSLKPD